MSIRAITTYCLALTFLAGASGVVYAQGSDTFEVSQVVTGTTDVIPPTTPTGLTATTVSTSQIDLLWNASTDNVAVTGYKVFRDGLFVATSTMTSYSDIGLTASTTYGYTVAAFDAVLNISTTSATATATTFAESVDTGGTGGGGGNSSRRLYIDIFNVQVTPEKQAAVLSWKTNVAARSRVSWGHTQDYEIGQLSDVSGRLIHQVRLERLSSGEQYYARIEALDSSGVVQDTFVVSFVTGAIPDVVPPGAVTNFQAIGKDSVIDLSWTNPPDPDFAEVRIIRSDKFFPTDIFGGRVIYEGDATQIVDTEVARDVTYYYAAFARDTLGNYAAPAVAVGRVGAGAQEPFEEFPEAPVIPPAIDELSLSDFEFFQEGNQVTLFGMTIPVDGHEALTAAVSYEKLPEVLKTIGVTLTDPDSTHKSFSFLLRIDDKKEHYSATIAPLKKPGRYPLLITVLDFKNQRLKRIEGELLVTGESMQKEIHLTPFQIELFVFFILLLLLLRFLPVLRKNS